MAAYTATLTSKGQITIPVEVRRLWRLQAGDSVEFFLDQKGEVFVRPLNAGPTDFLAVFPARSRLPGVVSDDDAIGKAVLRRNAPRRSREAAE